MTTSYPSPIKFTDSDGDNNTVQLKNDNGNTKWLYAAQANAANSYTVDFYLSTDTKAADEIMRYYVRTADAVAFTHTLQVDCDGTWADVLVYSGAVASGDSTSLNGGFPLRDAVVGMRARIRVVVNSVETDVQIHGVLV